jgi:hypothetical protein
MGGGGDALLERARTLSQGALAAIYGMEAKGRIDQGMQEGAQVDACGPMERGETGHVEGREAGVVRWEGLFGGRNSDESRGWRGGAEMQGNDSIGVISSSSSNNNNINNSCKNDFVDPLQMSVGILENLRKGFAILGVTPSQPDEDDEALHLSGSLSRKSIPSLSALGTSNVSRALDIEGAARSGMTGGEAAERKGFGPSHGHGSVAGSASAEHHHHSALQQLVPSGLPPLAPRAGQAQAAQLHSTEPQSEVSDRSSPLDDGGGGTGGGSRARVRVMMPGSRGGGGVFEEELPELSPENSIELGGGGRFSQEGKGSGRSGMAGRGKAGVRKGGVASGGRVPVGKRQNVQGRGR